MWFIADIIERYTNNVAKTFIKLAAMEAEANKRALEELREKRRRQVAEDGKLLTRAAMVHPHTGEPLTAESARANAVHTPKPAERRQPAERDDPAAILKARTKGALAQLPRGVRGEVVVRYVDGLIAGGPQEVAELLDRLAKDKKVRVAELQVIVAAVLDEEPEQRKKADHVARLRRHLVEPLERPRTAHDRAVQMLAAE